jgi:hypothetical protein
MAKINAFKCIHHIDILINSKDNSNLQIYGNHILPIPIKNDQNKSKVDILFI